MNESLCQLVMVTQTEEAEGFPPLLCRDALERQLLAEAGVFGLCEGTWAGHGGLRCHRVHPKTLC